MGYYINPPDMSKEDFLIKHGESIQQAEAYDAFTDDTLPVCLVDNGMFTAAGIAYNTSEINAFMRPDGRPKAWFKVPRSVLTPYYSEV